MLTQVHIVIQGDVIGVGFRAWTLRQAVENKVNGWVKNSGSQVEAVFQGEKENVEKMIGFVKKGPSASAVEKVDVSYEKPSEIFNDFKIA